MVEGMGLWRRVWTMVEGMGLWRRVWDYDGGT